MLYILGIELVLLGASSRRSAAASRGPTPDLTGTPTFILFLFYSCRIDFLVRVMRIDLYSYILMFLACNVGSQGEQRTSSSVYDRNKS